MRYCSIGNGQRTNDHNARNAAVALVRWLSAVGGQPAIHDTAQLRTKLATFGLLAFGCRRTGLVATTATDTGHGKLKQRAVTSFCKQRRNIYVSAMERSLVVGVTCSLSGARTLKAMLKRGRGAAGRRYSLIIRSLTNCIARLNSWSLLRPFRCVFCPKRGARLSTHNVCLMACSDKPSSIS